MLCFTVLTEILNCTIGLNCVPGAFIYHDGENTKIARIYGFDMLKITVELQENAFLSSRDISVDSTILADMYCVRNDASETVKTLIDDLLDAAKNNHQENIQRISTMLKAYRINPSNSTKKWLLQRRAFKTLRGKYDCVRSLNGTETEVPLLKTNFPTGFSTISSEEDFVIKSYRADFAMITLIGISDLKILDKKMHSTIAYPTKDSIDSLQLGF
ncbi:hypothetical protein Golomagni_03103 [Golovinomyces magnicellulatus]|nr:hypothetical protein Golomagni_03103 [Golovinomyces magnicellulatus]